MQQERKLFGIPIFKKKDKVKSFAPPVNEDGAVTIEPSVGGSYGHYLDLSGSTKNVQEVVTKYREMCLYPEVDSAIDDVVNEAIVYDDSEPIVDVNLEKVDFLTDGKKRQIQKEFQNILTILDFSRKGHDIFRRWYIDGRIYYHIIVDDENKKKGIKELRQLDPRKIRKVREMGKKKPDSEGPKSIEGKPGENKVIPTEVKEYYVYNQKEVKQNSQSMQGIKIHPDSIAYVVSGLYDHKKNLVLGHLHKAIKPLNQVRMLEDALVIYRISRAPERRIFYIDVGNMPKVKAEQYLKETMARYKNKIVYDVNTGDIKDQTNHMSMLEDYWLPRREGGRGTEISTLPGGQNLSQIEDVTYFQKKLYKALNVPVSRLEQDNGFSLGRASEITRDELKFSRFIHRMRTKFNELFNSLLKSQLILKGIVTEKDWNIIQENLYYKYVEDSYYREAKENEILTSKLMLLRDATMYPSYISKEFVWRKVLHLSQFEMEDMKDQIEQEKAEMGPEDEMQQQQGMQAQWGQFEPEGEMIAEDSVQKMSPIDEFINKLGIDMTEETNNVLYKLLENVNGEGHRELMDSMSEDTVSKFLTHITEEL